ncbi:MAG TPA: DUF3618 domain-containing protein [Jiangellaceae bacterium]|nr:DUF3618 domain-containing protein [Jiangellaceae bacterium]
MTSTEQAGSASEPVLPSSRRPVPGSEEFQREVEARRSRDGDAGKQRRRSVAEIEADLQATTDRLSANVDELVERMRPSEVARRTVERAKRFATTPGGRPRAEVVGAAVGALVVAAALIWWNRRRS